MIAETGQGHGRGAETALRLLTMGGGRAVAAGLGFLATILIARTLEPSSLGLWSIALAAQGLALHLGEAGLRSIATAELARDPKAGRPLLRRYLRLRLKISTSVILAGWLAAFALVPGGWPLAALVLASLWPIALQLDWLPLALGRNRAACLLLLVRPLALLGLLLLVPPEDAPGLAVLFLLAWWLAAIASWPALRLLPPGSARTAPSERGLLRLALPVALVTAASQLVLSLDLLLVGWRFGAEAAAFYYLASAVLVAGLVVANGLGQSALARMAVPASDASGFRKALKADLELVAIVALSIGLAVAGFVPVLLPLAFGSDYAPATGLLFWLLPWFLLQHGSIVLLSAMTAARLGKRLLLANLAMLAVLVPALALAWLMADIHAFAVARGAAELVRLAALYLALPASLRPWRIRGK